MTRSFENIAPAERQALAVSAIQKARLALQHGDRRLARRYAEQAVVLAPNQEDPWLLLAALASPRASLDYLQRALQVNPASQRARKGMQWALERLQAAQGAPEPSLPPAPAIPAQPEIPLPLPPEATAEIVAPPPAPPLPLVDQSGADRAAASIAPPRVSPGARTAIRVRPVKRPKARPAMPLVMVYAFMLLCLAGILFTASLTPYYIRLWNDVSPTLLARAPILQTVVANLPVGMQPPKFVSGIVTETPVLPAGSGS